jgi:hypothetical protein
MTMTTRQNSTFVLSVLTMLGLAALLSAAAPATAYADDKKALVVFNTWVEVPGGLLPGGRYIFKEVDTSAGHTTQIIDEVSGTYIVSVASKQTERLKSSGETVSLESVSLREGRHNSPDAVRAWFRPGSRKGEEFIYPNGVNAETAMLIVPDGQEIAPEEQAAVTAQAAPAAEARESAAADTNQPPASAVAPATSAETQAPAAAAPATTQEAAPAPDPSQKQVEVPEAQNASLGMLPKTASEMSLVELAGAFALAFGTMLRAYRGRVKRSSQA